MLSNEEFIEKCRAYYENPYCHSEKEFLEDVNVFSDLKKAFTRYNNASYINIHLVKNNFVRLYNIFGKETNFLLFEKIEKGQWSCMIPFMMELKEYKNNRNLEIDEKIVDMIRTFNNNDG